MNLNKNALPKAEIIAMLRDGRLSLTDVLEAVIEVNGLVGVGLVDFRTGIDDYITKIGRLKSTVSMERFLSE